MQYNITIFDSLPSTNDHANGFEFQHGDVIVAHDQTNGRGQRGNKWSATKGLNLTFSLVIQPSQITVFQQFRISQMAALAALDAIKSLGADCKVKWPNDLYVEGMKIGGILIEHTSMGPEITKSIIGIGINVNQQIFPPEIPNPTSLKLLNINTTPENLLTIFLENFTLRYTQFPSDLHADYMANLWPGTGRFKDSSGEFQARILAINNDSGMMTLERTNGTQNDYYFKEVEFLL